MPFQWEVPFLVLVIVVAILYLNGRRQRGKAAKAGPPESGIELIDRLQRTLGMGIVVESAEPAELGAPVTLEATFIFGRYTTRIDVTGDSEAEALDEVARAAIVWRNSDFQHVPMWPGGG